MTRIIRGNTSRTLADLLVGGSVLWPLLKSCVMGFFLFLLGIGTGALLLYLSTSVGKRNNGIPSKRAPKARRNLTDDIKAAAYLINYFRGKNEIDASSYRRIREFLERASSDKENLPGRIDGPERPSETVEVKKSTSTTTSQETDSPAQHEITELDGDKPEPVVAEIISGSPEPPTALAPWERPDPPVAAPRRPLSELFAEFLKEKNIRWGELAAGILIIGSAIGLVVSLRNELSRTIPYFPALLFMFITAAIHGAGSYTLKKWKLRNTSRGTLIIGLMLVPLNFLSACILSGGEQLRRPLSDPLYWMAIGIGFLAFGFMTFYSSRLLLRKGYGVLSAGILALAAASLVANRITMDDSSSWPAMLVAIVAAFCLLQASSLVQRAVGNKVYWSQRRIHRLFIVSGLAWFAFACSVALILIRSSAPSHTVIAITPGLTAASIVISWIGLCLGPRIAANAEKNMRLVALGLTILGFAATVAVITSSISNPTVLMINGVIAAALYFTLSHTRSRPILNIAAWCCLAPAALVALHLFSSRLELDRSISWQTWEPLLFSGPSALCLIGLSALVTTWGTIGPARHTASATSHRRGALIIGATGCLLSLVAGILHRDVAFDTMTASILLVIAVIVLIAISIRRGQSGWPTLTAFVAAICVAFSVAWNPIVASWFAPLCRGLNVVWAIVAILHALMMATAATIASCLTARRVSPITREFARCSIVTTVIAVAAAVMFATAETGFATGTTLAGVVTLGLLAWSHRFDDGFQVNWATSFGISTGLVLVIAVVEFATSFGLPPSSEAHHWFYQAIVLSLWSLVWTILAMIATRRRSKAWIIRNQFFRADYVGLALLVGMTLALTCWGLYESVGRELVASFESQRVSLTEFGFTAFAATIAVFLAVMLSLFERFHVLKASAAVVVFVLTWLLGSIPFDESHASGSAIRWLSASAAISASLVMFFHHGLRRLWTISRATALKLPSETSANDDITQDWGLDTGFTLVNLLLLITVLLTLSISSLATAQLLLTEAGRDALGGPLRPSFFGNMKAEISYGVPGFLLTTAILFFAISQRRNLLAACGSSVYQYVVLFSIAMLFLSPHPAIATKRFIGILQAVSIGMSGYGFLWYWQQERIDGERATSANRPRLIELHTAINVIMVSSLALIIGWRFWGVPSAAQAWIDEAGGWLGLVALGTVAVLSYLVLKDRFAVHPKVDWQPWLAGWTGLVFTIVLAPTIEALSGQPWSGLRTITWGSLVVGGSLLLFAYRSQSKQQSKIESSDDPRSRTAATSLPALIVLLIGGCYALRGFQLDTNGRVIYGTANLFCVVGINALGMVSGRARMTIPASILGILGVNASLSTLPFSALPSGIFTYPNLWLVVMMFIAIAWDVYHIRYARQAAERQKNWAVFSNFVVFVSTLWMVAASLFEWLSTPAPVFGSKSPLWNALGLTTVSLFWIFVSIHLWNGRGRFHVFSRCLGTLGLVLFGAAIIPSNMETRIAWTTLATGTLIAIWGWIGCYRARLISILRTWKIPATQRLKKSLERQLPFFSLCVGMLVLTFATLIIGTIQPRHLRYIGAVSGIPVSLAFGLLSDRTKRRWLQQLTLLGLTFVSVLIALADVAPEPLFDNPVSTWARILMVLAGGMFVYGIFVSRWVQWGDHWLRSLREAVVFTCAAAVLCLIVVVIQEAQAFSQFGDVPLSLAESIGTLVVVAGMIAGLLTIALRPENDPFSFSMNYRTGYVYAAEAVSALLLCHLYFTMPWLFQIGIKDYWPYIAIALAFAGVGAAHVLEDKGLSVLAKPIFNTAAILPILATILIWSVDSKADAAAVLLVAGLAYLLISYTHQSLYSGTIALVLGNFALWVFYGRFPSFSFLNHPQLWLIPPAASILIAAQIVASSLSRQQLAGIRYVCIAVIYVSSTSEIFIRGIGDQLWPPVVLALLSLIGLFLGILVQIRAFLYLGALFLLIAMISMVSHAHQRLDHVWPWWAFGIGMGISILVLFGLFESRRNSLRELATKLKQWEP